MVGGSLVHGGIAVLVGHGLLALRHREEHAGVSLYYDLEGRPISQEEFIELRSGPSFRIAKTDVWGDGRCEVSTVWLGIDHSFGEGPPIIFETIVFYADGNQDMQYRYSTLEEARAGHAKIVHELIDAGILMRELLPEYREP